MSDRQSVKASIKMHRNVRGIDKHNAISWRFQAVSGTNTVADERNLMVSSWQARAGNALPTDIGRAMDVAEKDMTNVPASR